MSSLRFRIHLLTVMIAASYVTLCLANLDDAKRWAVAYGLVMLLLGLMNLWCVRNGR
jgi:predicted membrane channel-forming protein YqfA (hemolysin III family)